MENTAIRQEAEILMRDLMSRAQHAKTEICREKGMADSPNMLVVVFEPKTNDDDDDDQNDMESLSRECKKMGLTRALQCAVIPLIHKPDPAECLHDIIGMMPIDNFEFSFLCCEGYTDSDENKTKKKVANNESYQRGEMAKDFAENPFTTIVETVMIHGYDWNLTNKFTNVCSFKYDDNGLPVFTEIVFESNEASENDERGRLDELLYRGIQFLHFNQKADGILKHWRKPSDSDED